MALQTSNPRIIRLVTEVSERTGEDAEAVIETALLERLERLPQATKAAVEGHLDAAEKERWERVYALVRDMQRRYKVSGVTSPTTPTSCMTRMGSHAKARSSMVTMASRGDR